jgi:hypothetical protein
LVKIMAKVIAWLYLAWPRMTSADRPESYRSCAGGACARRYGVHGVPQFAHLEFLALVL